MAERVIASEAGPPIGVEAIRRHLAGLTGRPGVYRMIDARGAVLYVGKARNLRRRVTSYTTLSGHTHRIRRMIRATTRMEFVTTRTESEALLLEANLIKRLKPRYNVLLRDDKSFPYILIRGGHGFPQLAKHRGARQEPGAYFGPFASAGAVNRTLNQLQKAFLLRTCSDSVFANRVRPCLLHQIRRCSGPCAGEASEEEYASQVREAEHFLRGRSTEVQERLAAGMKEASDALDFERAAVFRDRIRALSEIQARQGINPRTVDDGDLFAAHVEGNQGCVQAVFYRSHMHWGDRAYFPRLGEDDDATTVLGAFICQFYARREPPPRVILSHPVDNPELIEEALGGLAGRSVRLVVPKRGEKRELATQAEANARQALARRLAQEGARRDLLEGVAQSFGLEEAPRRIEVFDSSHIQGASPVVAMIVSGAEGLVKSQYRKFNMDRATLAPGDDPGMLRSALTRRFARLLREDPDREGEQWPDLVLIDGGAGQLAAAQDALEGLGLEEIPLVAIAKGPDREGGREVFHRPGRTPELLRDRDPVLYFVQRLRDEAHRFAVGAHRVRRRQTIRRTALDEVAGVGAARKRALLERFGSATAVGRAGVQDLAGVPGVSRALAQRIHDAFHGDD